MHQSFLSHLFQRLRRPGRQGADPAVLLSDWLDSRGWAIKETPTGLGGRSSEDSDSILAEKR
jgi:hypothetical protein